MQIPYIWYKDRENGPLDIQIALLIVKKKRLTQAKYIAWSAGLPSGLKNSKITRVNCTNSSLLPIPVHAETGFRWNINDKNCSLSIALTAMDQKLQKS